ncbi:MAG: LAGLIDADG family homing endonuclease [Chloroflexi bacterium]|nr:LAGLIDADG family homing endonuclease [Chloroflexota bacterium]
MKLCDTESAYAAGILDGEGSIQFTRNRRARLPSPTVSISSTDRELLEWFRVRCGGSIIRKRVYAPHHSPSYDWKLTDRKALQFLKIVRPFLVIRRKIVRCDLLLSDYLACTPRNGRYTPELAVRKQELIDRFASLP